MVGEVGLTSKLVMFTLPSRSCIGPKALFRLCFTQDVSLGESDDALQTEAHGDGQLPPIGV